MSEIDIFTIVEIEKETFGSGSWVIENFSNYLERPNTTSWIIESNDKIPVIIGYATQEEVDETSYISKICIDQTWRGCGFGRILLEHLIEQAKQTEKKRVTLDVDLSNSTAKSLYESCGFQYSDVRPNYYGEDQHGLHMVLDL